MMITAKIGQRSEGEKERREKKEKREGRRTSRVEGCESGTTSRSKEKRHTPPPVVGHKLKIFLG
jgi:hypothetical protein